MGESLKHVLPYAVNFSIFAIILGSLLRKPLQKFVFQRHERIKDFVESSAGAHASALDRAKRARGVLLSFDSEIAAVEAEELRLAKEEAAELIARAKKDVERVALDAKRIAENEAQELSDGVRAKFLLQAIDAADASLRDDLKSEQHNYILRAARSSIEAGA